MNLQIKAGPSEPETISFNLPIIIFEEDGAVICYCPAMDISGYGLSEQEAMDSYKYVLNEYFDYCVQNKTLIQDLVRLGWQFKKRVRKNIIPPQISKLLKQNDNFKRVFENFDYKKRSTNIRFPAF